MILPRLVKLFSFLVLLLAVSRGWAEIIEEAKDCATPGECVNPDAGEPVAEADEPAAEEDVAEVEEPPAAEVKVPEDPACPSRPHIIRCAAAYLDTNKNNKLEREELQNAIDSLSWLSRGVLNILGSIDAIMKKCDADGDDAIGIDTDMEATKETCLASCFKKKAFKKAFFPECDL